MGKRAYEKSPMEEYGYKGSLPKIPGGKCSCPHCGESLDLYVDIGIQVGLKRVVLLPKGTIAQSNIQGS